jgi:hypothetical protein
MREPVLVRVPTVPPLEQDVLDRLPVDTLVDLRRELEHRRADVEAAITRRLARPSPTAATPDRALGIEEAMSLLGMTQDYIYRNWPKLGGYKDADGHVKFALSTVQRYIRTRAGR